MKHIVLFLIKLYQRCVSPLFAPACRFEPSCSQYAREAIEHYGAVRGCGMACLRLLKCHPFHPGGCDPVK